jgi:hypothetical protein
LPVCLFVRLFVCLSVFLIVRVFFRLLKVPFIVFSPPYALSHLPGFDLLCRLLDYNPTTRITALQALEHKYFKEDPVPLHKYARADCVLLFFFVVFYLFPRVIYILIFSPLMNVKKEHLSKTY